LQHTVQMACMGISELTLSYRRRDINRGSGGPGADLPGDDFNDICYFDTFMGAFCDVFGVQLFNSLIWWKLSRPLYSLKSTRYTQITS